VLAIGVFLCGVLATASRGAGIATGMAIFFMLLPSLKRWPHPIVCALLPLIIVAPLMVKETNLFSRGSLGDIVAHWTSADVESLGKRTPIWQEAPQALNATGNPGAWLHGVGLGGVDKTLGVVAIKGSTLFQDGIRRAHTHNEYLELLMGLGLLALPLEAYLLGSLVWWTYKLDRAEQCLDRISILFFWGTFSLTAVVTRELYWPGIGGIILTLLCSNAACVVTPMVRRSRAATLAAVGDAPHPTAV